MGRADSPGGVLVPRVVIAGAVLLLGAAGFAVAELTRRHALAAGTNPGGA